MRWLQRAPCPVLTPYLLTATTAALPVNPLPPPPAESALTAAAEPLTPPQIAVAPNPEAAGGHTLVSGLPAPQPSFSAARQPLATAALSSLTEATVQTAAPTEQQLSEPAPTSAQTKNAGSIHPGAQGYSRPSPPELGLAASQAAWSPKVAASAYPAPLSRPEPAIAAPEPPILRPESELSNLASASEPATLALEAEIPNSEPAASPVETENQPEPSTPEIETTAPAAPNPEAEILDSDPGTPSSETEDPESEPDVTSTEAPFSEPTEESAETEAELFERIFGRPPPQDQAIAVPFFINDQPQGQAIVVIAEGSASQVQARPGARQNSVYFAARLAKSIGCDRR